SSDLHPLTPHLGTGHLDATALTDDALEAHTLVLAAVALPVPGGAEDLLAEQALLLRLEGAVVDGLRLLDLAVGPVTDVLDRREADDQRVVVVDGLHVRRAFTGGMLAGGGIGVGPCAGPAVVELKFFGCGAGRR